MEDQIGAAIDALLGEEQQTQQEQEVKQSENPQPDENVANVEVESQAQGDEQEEELPNAKIRLDKMKKQRDEEREAREALQREIENLKGQVDMFAKMNTNKEPEQDPTEYMSETEKALYEHNRMLEEKINKLNSSYEQISSKVVMSENRQREENFFKNNPSVNKEDARELITNYVKSNPVVGRELLSGEVSIQSVYDLALVKSGRPILPKPQDASKVFGDGKSEPIAPRDASKIEDNYSKVLGALNPKMQSDQRENAIDALIGDISSEFMKNMDK